MRSYCPVYRPSCELVPFDVSSARHQTQCRIVSYSTESTTCLCTISRSSSRQRRGLSGTSSQSPGVESGAIQLATVTKLVAQDFADTFTAAPDLTSPESIADAAIVITMFSTLWGMVMTLTCFCNWYKQKNNGPMEEKIKMLNTKVTPISSGQPGVSREISRNYVVDYILRVFPSAFQQKPRIRHLVEELSHRHKYFSLFLSWSSDHSDWNRIVTAAR
eukprot:gene55191-73729_t